MFRNLRTSAVYVRLAELLKRCEKSLSPHTPPAVPQGPFQNSSQAITQTRDEASNRDCPLLQMPLEILILIANDLSLVDQYFLSQTCSALHQYLQRDWHSALLKDRDREQRFYLFAELALRLHDQYVCSTCRQLHRIAPDSLKRAADDDPNDGEGECTTGFQGNFARNFGLECKEHHLQLVLKTDQIMRRQSTPQQSPDRQPTLMGQLWTWANNTHWEHELFVNVHCQVLHRPSIRDGCLRLHNSYKFTKYTANIGNFNFRDCPHLIFNFPMDHLQDDRAAGSSHDPRRTALSIISDPDDGPWVDVLAQQRRGGTRYLTGACHRCIRNGLWNRYMLWVEQGVLCMDAWWDYGGYWDVVRRDWGRRQPYLWGF